MQRQCSSPFHGPMWVVIQDYIFVSKINLDFPPEKGANSTHGTGILLLWVKLGICGLCVCVRVSACLSVTWDREREKQLRGCIHAQICNSLVSAFKSNPGWKLHSPCVVVATNAETIDLFPHEYPVSNFMFFQLGVFLIYMFFQTRIQWIVIKPFFFII